MTTSQPFYFSSIVPGGKSFFQPLITNRIRYWLTSVSADRIMEVNNTAFASPIANAPYILSQSSPVVDRIVASLNFWSVSLTLLLLAITYDQCTSFAVFHSTLTDTIQALTNFKNMASSAQRGRLLLLDLSLSLCDRISGNIKRNGQVAI